MDNFERFKTLNDADGFNAVNDIKITLWEDGFSAVRVDLTANHLNPMRLVHGGLYTAMLDVALAMTGSYRSAPEQLIPGLTLSLTTQFLAAVQQDESYLTAEARRTGGGKSVFFAEGEVKTSRGRLVATASGVFKPGRVPAKSLN